MEWVLKQNPWWKDKGWEERDSHIRKWEGQKIKWKPSWIEEISLKPFSLNFVYGMRQTGKTTGIKLLIRDLMKRIENPFSIFFFDFELISSLKELRKILEFYLEIRKKEKIDKSFIFLDEIASVPEWWRVIKFMIDAGVFENDVLVLLGSSSINLLKAPERFPGRRGNGKDVIVLPLSFPEFIKVHGFDVKRMIYMEEELRELWEKYKVSGGFPKSINEHPDSRETVIASMVSEIRKHEKSVQISQGIISSLLTKIPSPLSYHSVAQDIEISHKTVHEYLEFLEDSFILKQAYWKDGKVKRRKEKKVFFRDPLILQAFSFWTSTKFLESALYEHIIQEHLYRKYREIYYYRNKYEIDCVAGNLRIEVKAGKPHRKYPKNVIVLEEKDIPRFLVEIFGRKTFK